MSMPNQQQQNEKNKFQYYSILLLLTSPLSVLIQSHGIQHHVRPGKRFVRYRNYNEHSLQSRYLARENINSSLDGMNVFTIKGKPSTNDESIMITSTKLWTVREKTFINSTTNKNNSTSTNNINNNSSSTNPNTPLSLLSPDESALRSQNNTNSTKYDINLNNISSSSFPGLPSSSILSSSSQQQPQQPPYGTNKPVNNSSNEFNYYESIRITAVLTAESGGGKYLPPHQRENLLEMVSIALHAWHVALMVTPVEGSLTVDQSQLYDGKTCGPGEDSGLPSPEVPSEHFSIGVEDTDLLVYLSLGFASPSSSAVGDSNNETTKLVGNHTINETAQDSFLPKCVVSDTSVFASATYCSTDQNDRPTAGELYLCINNSEDDDDDNIFHPMQRQANILAIMHEIGHILGMNSVSLAYFREEDGSPLTPRNDDRSVPEVEVQCTGVDSMNKTMSIPLPSTSILDFLEDSNGIRSASVITPNVQRTTRNHFDCHNALSGAELSSVMENNCIGSHWDRRLFKTDLLNPILDEVADDVILNGNFSAFKHFLSPLTLAYFLDSGWYKINSLNNIGPATSTWGRRAGCSFVNMPCLDTEGEVVNGSTGEFCNVNGELGCTEDIASKALCQLQPHGQQKYGNKSGIDPFLDYCPTYIKYANGLCNNPKNEYMLRVHSIEDFIPNSRCILGHYDRGLTEQGRVPLCLPIACVISDQSLRIKVDGNWTICDYAGQHVLGQTDDGFKGWIECPDPVKVCPTFYCPHDCLDTYNGICDYNTGLCMCNNPSSLANSSTTTAFDFDNITTEWYNLSPNEEQQRQPLSDPNSGLSLIECSQMNLSSDVITNSSTNTASFEQSHYYHPEVDFFETKLSQYYVVNAEFLENDYDDYYTGTKVPPETTSYNHFETWYFYLAVALGIFALLVTMVLSFKWVKARKHRREGNKNKFVASMLVDLRVHDPDPTTRTSTTLTRQKRHKSKHKQNFKNIKKRLTTNVNTNTTIATNSSTTSSCLDGSSSLNSSLFTDMEDEENNYGVADGVHLDLFRPQYDLSTRRP